ncbi:MAG: RepB family DNA primase [Desulforhopalus sp.]|nr:RepB family DNA primase [Desulforhopalus sp.]
MNLATHFPHLPTATTKTDKNDVTDSLANPGVLRCLLKEVLETDESDVTYSSITNNDFLVAIFGLLPGDQRPVTCCFQGHPGKGASGRWFGQSWFSGKTYFSPEANNYFSLARFSPDGEGKYRRQKRNFAALHAVMLDDIGTKAEGLDRLTLSPSWLLETSAGNYQAGYIMSEPVTDGAIAESLVNTIINAGLCDPGSDSPTTRYARLPVGVNGKFDPRFSCRLTGFHPDRRYTVQQIVDGLQLDYRQTSEKAQGKRAVTSKQAGRSTSDEEVFVSRTDENPIIASLKEYGLYIKTQGGGKHEINCPWQHEHTGGIGGGTAYFEPNESFPIGGFKCMHGHCSDRHMRDLREYLGISTTEAKHRDIIRVIPGELARIVDLCERQMANIGRYYQSGGLVVHIVTDPGTRETTVANLAMTAIVRALSSIVCFQKFDKMFKRWVDCDPPERHCKILCDTTTYPHLSVLRGLSRQPYLRNDGSLMSTPGYDQATGMFGVFDEREFHVPPSPTKKDAEKALVDIDSLLDEFSFKTEHDRSAALAAIMTAAIRPSLSQAPMFHVSAPQIASGKSYLTALFAAFVTAVSTSGITFPRDDDECRKLLLATLLPAPSVICFDNLTSDLIPFASLCTALSEEYITGRILGVSKTATVGTRALFLSSGNNVGPIRDMARRTVTITLDPVCETPATRTFINDPVAQVRADRGRFVSLALTIVRAWVEAGRPTTKVKSLATYTDWAALCRQPLLWLGCPDPAFSIFESMAHDPDREALGQLLQAWQASFGDRPVMVREAAISTDVELREAIMDIASERGEINRKRLGKWISRHASRIVDGRRFEKDTASRSAEAWMVKTVTSVSSVFDHPSEKDVERDDTEIVTVRL